METVDKKLVESAMHDMYEDFNVYVDMADNEITRLKEEYKALFEEYCWVKFKKRIRYDFPDCEDALVVQYDQFCDTYFDWCDQLGLDDEGEDDED